MQIAGWIAQSVKFPIIMDGDTGHGGIMAVRRMVRECIHAGIAGIRIDDQPIEGKRKTQSAGMEVVPLEQAIARYRAAVDMKNELDPDFVIMAQCYARDAANSSLDDCIARLKAYREVAGVDWVQLESPHSIDEIKMARAAVDGPLSFMKGKLPRYLGLDEHLALGINIAWYPDFHASRDVGGAVGFHAGFPDRTASRRGTILSRRAARPSLSAAGSRRGRRGARQTARVGGKIFLRRRAGKIPQVIFYAGVNASLTEVRNVVPATGAPPAK